MRNCGRDESAKLCGATKNRAGFSAMRTGSRPRAWNSEAAAKRQRRRVFCASMADVFEDRRDLDDARRRLWNLIADTPHLDWQLLTKRPQMVPRLAPWGDNWPDNVWLGTTLRTKIAPISGFRSCCAYRQRYASYHANR